LRLLPPEPDGVGRTYAHAITAVRAVRFIRTSSHLTGLEALIAVVAFAGFIESEKRGVLQGFKKAPGRACKAAPGICRNEPQSEEAKDKKTSDEPEEAGVFEGKSYGLEEFTHTDGNVRSGLAQGKVKIKGYSEAKILAEGRKPGERVLCAKL